MPGHNVVRRHRFLPSCRMSRDEISILSFQILAKAVRGTKMLVPKAAKMLLDADSSGFVSTSVTPTHKASEPAIAKFEERLTLMVEAVVDYSIIMLDPKGLIASWNSGARRLKGYGPDDHRTTLFGLLS
jgi:PAS domain-containing protein